MRRFRKTAMILLVWVTSASTLLAGIPRLECGCPGGKVQSGGPGPSAKERTCCCGKSCPTKASANWSGPSEGQAQKKTSCCGGMAEQQGQGQPGDKGTSSKGSQKERTQTPGKSGKQLLAGTNGCQKTLVQPEQQSLSRAETNDRQALATGLFFSSASAPAFFLTGPALVRNSWEVFLLPPPTDLVTLLQRLTI